MSIGWDDYEPAPLEFMHGRIMDLFHEYRKERTDSVTIEITGKEMNEFIRLAKIEAKEKYPEHIVRHNAVPKTEM